MGKRTKAPKTPKITSPPKKTKAPKVTYEGTITLDPFTGDAFPENTFPPAYPIRGSWTSTPAGNDNTISLANCEGVVFGGEIPPTMPLMGKEEGNFAFMYMTSYEPCCKIVLMDADGEIYQNATQFAIGTPPPDDD